jgi:hypothetical protein
VCVCLKNSLSKRLIANVTDLKFLSSICLSINLPKGPLKLSPKCTVCFERHGHHKTFQISVDGKNDASVILSSAFLHVHFSKLKY